jgi:cell division protein FtsB
MNMDHTGDSGDPIESAVEAELVDDAVDEIAADEIVADEIVADEIVATDDENPDDDIDETDEDGGNVEPEAIAAKPSATRERHPTGAAAIAKRVAMDRPTRIGVASLVFVALMFMFVFPTRSYLAQQRQVRDARHSVQVLRAQNAKLEREAQRLQTPNEIEKLARSQFNMVFEGEEAYNVVPPHGSATTTTTDP